MTNKLTWVLILAFSFIFVSAHARFKAVPYSEEIEVYVSFALDQEVSSSDAIVFQELVGALKENVRNRCREIGRSNEEASYNCGLEPNAPLVVTCPKSEVIKIEGDYVFVRVDISRGSYIKSKRHKSGAKVCSAKSRLLISNDLK